MTEQARRRAARPGGPEMVRRQVVVEDHDLAPDGAFAVVVRRSVHGSTYRSHLWLVPLPAGPDGGGTRRRVRDAAGRPARARTVPLTSGAVRDTTPRIAPDGRRVAFLRSFPDDPGRPVAVMVGALDGGEPWTLVAPRHGVTDIAWSPDGRRIAFVAPGEERRFAVGADAPIAWDFKPGASMAHATLDGGKSGEVILKNTVSSSAPGPVVIQNLRYFGASRNDGFVLMPNEVEAYRIGDKPFEFKGTNGFMITFDISSKDAAAQHTN